MNRPSQGPLAANFGGYLSGRDALRRQICRLKFARHANRALHLPLQSGPIHSQFRPDPPKMALIQAAHQCIARRFGGW